MKEKLERFKYLQNFLNTAHVHIHRHTHTHTHTHTHRYINIHKNMQNSGKDRGKDWTDNIMRVQALHQYPITKQSHATHVQIYWHI